MSRNERFELESRLLGRLLVGGAAALEELPPEFPPELLTNLVLRRSLDALLRLHQRGEVDGHVAVDRVADEAHLLDAERALLDEARDRAGLADEVENLASDLADLEAIAQERQPPAGRGPGAAAALVQLTERAGVDLFHDTEGEPFAYVDGQTWRIRQSRGFDEWLSGRFYRETGRALAEQALQEARRLLAARACFDGRQQECYVRLAPRRGGIQLDLADPGRHVVEVDSSDWRVIAACDTDARFLRPKGLLPLPVPARGAQLSDLQKHLNLQGDDDWSLVAGWLVASLALAPRGQFPILCLVGEHGSGKSTAAGFLRALVDPNAAPLRGEPRSSHDLAISARNSHVIALDNISSIPSWLSDDLCRMVTGGGSGVRTLFTDAEETLFAGVRPVLITSIAQPAQRGDLIDRMVTVTLPNLDEARNRSSQEHVRRFEAAAPQLLGALFDAVALALRQRPLVKLERRPRLADFAEVGVAAEGAMGVAPGTFLRALQANREAGSEAALEGEPFIAAVVDHFEERGGWEGSAKDLLRAVDRPSGVRIWPESPRAAAAALQRAAPHLRRKGYEVSTPQAPGGRSASKRRWRIKRDPAKPGAGPGDRHPNPSSPGGGDCTGNDGVTDVTVQADLFGLRRPLDEEELRRAEEAVGKYPGALAQEIGARLRIPWSRAEALLEALERRGAARRAQGSEGREQSRWWLAER